MFLVSSNPRKLKELARYGLELELRSGADLPEVDGTPLEVAIHKAKLAGPGAVVEDTVVIVAGQPWVDIRWNTQALQEHEGAPVTWQVTLAHNDIDEDDYAFSIEDLRPIQLTRFDFERYAEGRSAFTRDEWISAVLRSVGLEPSSSRSACRCTSSLGWPLWWSPTTTTSSWGHAVRESPTSSVSSRPMPR